VDKAPRRLAMRWSGGPEIMDFRMELDPCAALM